MPTTRPLAARALCALLTLTGAAHGRILVREADGGTALPSRASAFTTTDVLTSAGTFTTTSAEDFDRRREQLHGLLETLGFQYGWEADAGDAAVSTWYSSALGTTLVCVESITDTGLTHHVYAMPGHMGRNAYFLW